MLLNVSFRSTPAVLQAVDAVFADPAVRAGVVLENGLIVTGRAWPSSAIWNG